jgi:hypothetical protein
MKPIQFRGKETMSYNKTEQPTAEGAEEILKKYIIYCKNVLAFEGKIWVVKDVIPTAMTEFATLHAQRIADKMVSERLKEELIRYIKWYGGFNYENMTDEMLVNEYLKTRDSHESV